MVDEKIICAGFGGQGVMKMGQILTYAGMIEGKQVSWLPSYGPEMRGGTANCNVMVSDQMIGSPIITNDATTVIAMNLPSLVKFEKNTEKGGNILVNSSLIERKVQRWGNSSIVIVLPPDVAKYLELEPDNPIILKPEEKSKGKFCSFWKKE